MAKISLKVEDFEKNGNGDGELSVSVREKRSEKTRRKKNLTFISLFRNILKFAHDEKSQSGLPEPYKFFHIALTLAVLTALGTLFYEHLDKMVLLPILILAVTVFVPLALLAFFSEVDTTNIVTISEIFIMAALGGVSLVFCKWLESSYIYKISGTYISYLGAFYLGALEQLIELLVIMLFARKFRKNGLLTCMFVGACVCAGFAFFEGISVAFKSIFLQTGVADGEITAIFTDSDSLTASLQGLMAEAPVNIILRGVLVISFGAVLGGMIYILNRQQAESFTARTSILLFILTIIANAFWNMPFINGYFEFMLKILMLVVMGLCVVKMINVGLAEREYTL